MKKKLFVILVQFIIISSTSQNWLLFNKNYRYNYHFDNSLLVSNVLFADTFLLSAGDTILKLNKIVAKCNGSFCPTSTIVLPTGNTYYINNMPQFLQRNVIIKPTYTRLFDTLKLNIFTNCIVGDIWKFDSLNNVNVTCINKHQQITFGVIDSIKTLLIGTNDTLKLSKQFGVLQWPELYNKNKYYKLTGVELSVSYSPTPLYGERVPNAWDFYNFNVGDKFGVDNYNYWSNASTCNKSLYTVLNKSVGVNSYTYQLSSFGYTYTGSGPNGFLFCQTTGNSVYTGTINSNLFHNNLSSKGLIENSAYPNKLIALSLLEHNVANFTTDNINTFYKYWGIRCAVSNSNSPQINVPNNTPKVLYSTYTVVPTNTLQSVSTIYQAFNVNYQSELSAYYGANFGKISEGKNHGFGAEKRCVFYFEKNGTQYFGPLPFTLGMNQNSSDLGNYFIFPNPTSQDIFVSTDFNLESEIMITNLLGEIIYKKINTEKNHRINVSNFPSGIYFLIIKTSANQTLTKKFVVER